jgi:hypothetical protein
VESEKLSSHEGATFKHTKKSSQHISLLNTFLIKNA